MTQSNKINKNSSWGKNNVYGSNYAFPVPNSAIGGKIGTTNSMHHNATNSMHHNHQESFNDARDIEYSNRGLANHEGLDFEDVLIVPSINHNKNLKSRKDVDLTFDGHRVPIVAANMDHIGTFAVAKELSKNGLMTAIIKSYTVSDWKKEVVEHDIDVKCLIPTIGLQNFNDELKKVINILEEYELIDHICFDVANGYLYDFRKKLDLLRKNIPDEVSIIAGNVVTHTGATMLHEHGADIIKIGIGPGSVCTTREMTGVGMPQFSAIMECNRAKAKNPKMKLMADGGCVTSGDMAKAFGVCDYVMIGGMLAGHYETGHLVYGNSSEIALQKLPNNGSYRASEGRVVNLKEDRGPLSHSVQNWLGGLRSACTYCNSSSLANLQQSATYVKVRRQLNTSLVT